MQAVEIVDDHTVKFVLSRPFAPLLAALSDRAGMMVSPKAAGDGAFASHPVCSGPYKFVERVAQDRIVLARFSDYWNKDAVHVDQIVFLPIPNSTVRLANLQSGSLDLIERVDPTNVDAVKKDPRLKFADTSQPRLYRHHDQPEQRPEIEEPSRPGPAGAQALELSIDRAALNQVVFDGMFEPGNQWISPGNPYYIKSMPIPSRDVAKAKQLLAAANAPRPVVKLMVQTTPK